MINLLRQLWRDEAGYVLSAEAVTVGTLGVVGATVGMGAVSKSVNDELTETAFALRSLDQSFTIPEQRGAGSWTAGSVFVQPDQQQARAELGRYVEEQGGTVIGTSRRDHRTGGPGTQAPAATASSDRNESREVAARSPKDREQLRRLRQQARKELRSQQEQGEADSPTDAP